MKLYWKYICIKQGRHYWVKVFSSPNPDGTYVKLGDLIIDEKDYEALTTNNITAVIRTEV